MIQSWISVKEKLPQIGEEVLIYDVYEDGSCGYGVLTYVTTLYGVNYFAKVFEDDPAIDLSKSFTEITHWQPLPKPPIFNK